MLFDYSPFLQGLELFQSTFEIDNEFGEFVVEL